MDGWMDLFPLFTYSSNFTYFKVKFTYFKVNICFITLLTSFSYWHTSFIHFTYLLLLLTLLTQLIWHTFTQFPHFIHLFTYSTYLTYFLFFLLYIFHLHIYLSVTLLYDCTYVLPLLILFLYLFYLLTCLICVTYFNDSLYVTLLTSLIPLSILAYIFTHRVHLIELIDVTGHLWNCQKALQLHASLKFFHLHIWFDLIRHWLDRTGVLVVEFSKRALRVKWHGI